MDLHSASYQHFLICSPACFRVHIQGEIDDGI